MDLTTRGEKIDALIGWIGLHSSAWCYSDAVSTVGKAKASRFWRFEDEDVFSDVEPGYWVAEEFLDSSEIPGLAAEDVGAANYDDNSAGEFVYLTIKGKGRISGYQVGQKDIFAVGLGSTIWHHLVWHGPDHGWRYNIDAFDYDPE